MIVSWKAPLWLRRAMALGLLVAVCPIAGQAQAASDGGPDGSQAATPTIVRFETVEGSFDVELFDELMPRTVANFLDYVTEGRYDGSVVHRNSDTADPELRDFVIQGGGFFLEDPVAPASTITFSGVPTNPTIDDEPGGGVAGPSNLRGTIAMAKSGPNTATSQWFINQGDNSFLDDPQRPDGGFAAFGTVTGGGMTVVDAIGDLPIPPDFGFTIASPFSELPLRNFAGDSIDDIREIHTVVVLEVVIVPEPTSSALSAASLIALLLIRLARRHSARQA
jgi:cyclophilin family peptidyl-prolyl cis-trans isomerase